MKKLIFLLIFFCATSVFAQTFTLDNDTSGAFSKRLSSFCTSTIASMWELYKDKWDVTLYSDSAIVIGLDASFSQKFTWEAGTVFYCNFKGSGQTDLWFKAITGTIYINGVIKPVQ